MYSVRTLTIIQFLVWKWRFNKRVRKNIVRRKHTNEITSRSAVTLYVYVGTFKLYVACISYVQSYMLEMTSQPIVIAHINQLFDEHEKCGVFVLKKYRV